MIQDLYGQLDDPTTQDPLIFGEEPEEDQSPLPPGVELYAPPVPAPAPQKPYPTLDKVESNSGFKALKPRERRQFLARWLDNAPGVSSLTPEEKTHLLNRAQSRHPDDAFAGDYVLNENHIKQFLGIPYKFGGECKTGMDCSAFTQQLYQRNNVNGLPRTADAQWKAKHGTPVTDLNSIQPGDQLFFSGRRLGPGRASHTAYFAGWDQTPQGQIPMMYAASSSAGAVVKQRLDNYLVKSGMTFLGAKRYPEFQGGGKAAPTAQAPAVRPVRPAVAPSPQATLSQSGAVPPSAAPGPAVSDPEMEKRIQDYSETWFKPGSKSDPALLANLIAALEVRRIQKKPLLSVSAKKAADQLAKMSDVGKAAILRRAQQLVIEETGYPRKLASGAQIVAREAAKLGMTPGKYVEAVKKHGLAAIQQGVQSRQEGEEYQHLLKGGGSFGEAVMAPFALADRALMSLLTGKDIAGAPDTLLGAGMEAAQPGTTRELMQMPGLAPGMLRGVSGLTAPTNIVGMGLMTNPAKWAMSLAERPGLLGKAGRVWLAGQKIAPMAFLGQAGYAGVQKALEGDPWGGLGEALVFAAPFAGHLRHGRVKDPNVLRELERRLELPEGELDAPTAQRLVGQDLLSAQTLLKLAKGTTVTTGKAGARIKGVRGAVKEGQVPEGRQPEHPRVPPRANVPADAGQVREGAGEQAGGGGGVERGGAVEAEGQAAEAAQPQGLIPSLDGPFDLSSRDAYDTSRANALGIRWKSIPGLSKLKGVWGRYVGRKDGERVKNPYIIVDPDRPMGTTTHELQHHVQEELGFVGDILPPEAIARIQQLIHEHSSRPDYFWQPQEALRWILGQYFKRGEAWVKANAPEAHFALKELGADRYRNILKPYDVALAEAGAAGAKPQPQGLVRSVQDFVKQISQHPNITPEQAKTLGAHLGVLARAWAKAKPGRTPKQFFESGLSIENALKAASEQGAEAPAKGAAETKALVDRAAERAEEAVSIPDMIAANPNVSVIRVGEPAPVAPSTRSDDWYRSRVRNYDEHLKSTNPQTAQALFAMKENAVFTELDAGRPVPPEILAEHPRFADQFPEAYGKKKPEAAKEPWQMTRDSFIQGAIDSKPKKELRGTGLNATVNDAGKEHAQLVQNAFREGKPVPPEVLADYPNLQKAAAAPAEGTSLRDRLYALYEERMPELADAVIAKNVSSLLKVLESGAYSDIIRPANKASRAIFEFVTGIKLPQSEKDAITAVRGWYNAGGKIRWGVSEPEKPTPTPEAPQQFDVYDKAGENVITRTDDQVVVDRAKAQGRKVELYNPPPGREPSPKRPQGLLFRDVDPQAMMRRARANLERLKSRERSWIFRAVPIKSGDEPQFVVVDRDGNLLSSDFYTYDREEAQKAADRIAKTQGGEPRIEPAWGIRDTRIDSIEHERGYTYGSQKDARAAAWEMTKNDYRYREPSKEIKAPTKYNVGDRLKSPRGDTATVVEEMDKKGYYGLRFEGDEVIQQYLPHELKNFEMVEAAKPETGENEPSSYDPQMGDIVEYDGKTYEVGFVTPGKLLRLQDPITKERVPGQVHRSEVKPVTEEATAPLDATGASKLASAVYGKLTSGESLGNVTELNKMAEEAFGSSRVSGKWTPKDAFDAMEAGVNKYLLDHGKKLLGQDAHDAIGQLRDLMDRITTQGTRTDEQIKNQQFSTPPTEAYLVAKIADLKPTDVVLEPSAGNGGLALWPKAIGAKVHVNEIAPRRIEVLKMLGFDEPTAHDGELINAYLGADVKPTVVLMNPPFSASTMKAHEAKNRSKYGFNHVEQALQRLEPNGRLVAILGGGQANEPNGGASLTGGASGEWFKRIASRYNIRANVRIDGKEYQKYGTSFATRIIVIDKDRPTTLGTTEGSRWENVVQGNFSTLEEAYDALRTVAGTRPTAGANEQAPTTAGVGAVRAPSGGEQKPPTGVDGGGGAGEPGNRPGIREGAEDRGEVGTPDLSGRPPGEPRGDVTDTGGERTPLLEPTTRPEERKPEGEAAGDVRGSRPNADAERPPAVTAEPPSARESLDQFKKAAEGGNVKSALELLKEQAKLRIQNRKKEAEGETFFQHDDLEELDPYDLVDYATIGATHVADGRSDFDSWRTAMVADLGDDISPYLDEIWAKTKPAYDKHIKPLLGDQAPVFGEKYAGTPDTGEALPTLHNTDSNVSVEEVKRVSGGETEDTSAFVRYRPTLQGPDHPANIVETKSMATVPLPKITYKPSLPESVFKEGRLSALQLEPVALAGQANETRLPSGHRGTFLDGDGTGVGKGRIGAAYLWDNWNKGRKRLVWVSENWRLVKDAIRDFNGIGATDLAKSVTKMQKFETGKPIEHEGVLFTTYALLRAENTRGYRRSSDIERWLRGNDDGEGAAIIWDESHNLKNAVPMAQGQASAIGETANTLMNRLPNLRSMYLSATAASDIMNLGYLDRLGLWGTGTPFPRGFADFSSSVGQGGISAMEMIARELKAAGKYVSRTLSYKGTVYREREHTVNPEQKELYRTAARAWSSVQQHVEDTITNTTNGGKHQKARALSQFYSAQQRFFNVLLTTLKIPTAVEEANHALSEGKSVVITLVNTNEAAQTREKNKARINTDNPDEIPDYDFGPKEMLINYIREHYPVQQWADGVDANGNPVKVPVTRNENGVEVPVENPQAVAERNALIEEIQRDLHMPANPLDIVIEALGGTDKVAELTGRKERFDHNRGEFVTRVAEGVNKEDVNKGEEAAFQSGKKRVAVLSNAAGTGISLHASKQAKNQQQRVHITLQPGWSADRAMQMFGRTHRSDQASAPEYVLIKTNLGGETRFISSLARRLGSLEAIAKGQTNTSEATEMMSKVNFETEQGRTAANAFYDSLIAGRRIPGVDMDPFALLTDMGVLKVDSRTGQLTVPPNERTNVTRLLNRLLSLDPDVQNAVYDYYFDIFTANVKDAIDRGILDTGVRTLPGDSFNVKEERVIATDEKTGAKTFYYPVDAEVKVNRVSPETLLSTIRASQHQNPQIVRNREGRLYLQVDAPPIVHADGKVDDAIYLVSAANAMPRKIKTSEAANRYREISAWAAEETKRIESELAEARYTFNYNNPKREDHEWYARKADEAQQKIDDLTAQLAESEKAGGPIDVSTPEKMAALPEWREQYENAPTAETRQHHLIGGAVLRYWAPIRHAAGYFRVYTTTDGKTGNRVVGIEIPKERISHVVDQISGGQGLIDWQQIYSDVYENNASYTLAGGSRILQGRVAGRKVIKIIPADDMVAAKLKQLGVIYERGVTPTYYLPEDRTEIDVLKAVVEAYPPENMAGTGVQAARALQTSRSAILPETTTGDEDSTYYQREEPASTFYSKAARVVSEKMPNRMEAGSLRNMLLNADVKPEEIQWSGLDELIDRGGTVTKADILRHLEENNVQLEEVTKGEAVSPAERDRIWKELQEATKAYNESPTDESLYERFAELSRQHDRAVRTAPDTKFGTYTSPGGENYRELLLTMPDTVDKSLRGDYSRLVERIAKRVGEDPGTLNPYDLRGNRFLTDNEESELMRIDKASNARPPAYRSSHWDEPNVLAHVRFDERKGPNGERVLHVAEIQSDWHQAGRKKGYRDTEAVATVRARLQRLEDERARIAHAAIPDGEWRAESFRNDNGGTDQRVFKGDVVVMETGDRTPSAAIETTKRLIAEGNSLLNEVIPGFSEIAEQIREAKYELDRLLSSNLPPDAPFKKTWHELALKRILRYAAEEGYDGVSWDPGAVQAERYDLSKHISELYYSRSNLVAHGHNGERVIELTGVRPEDIPNYVGKEVAERLMSQKPRGTIRSLTGLDLKVGGEGMKGFYDKMVPDALNKLGKPFGAKVGETRIPSTRPLSVEAFQTGSGTRYGVREEGTQGHYGTFETRAEAEAHLKQMGGEGMDVPYLPITPELRSAAMSEGFPLFQAKGGAPKASITFRQDDGAAIVRLTAKADVTSIEHEIFHFARRRMAEDYDAPDLHPQAKSDFDTLSEWSGAKKGEKGWEWDRPAEEKAARAWERYLHDGQAPTAQLKAVFDRLKEWFREVYKTITGTELDVKITPELRAVFDRMHTGAEGAPRSAEPPPRPRVDASGKPIETAAQNSYSAAEREWFGHDELPEPVREHIGDWVVEAKQSGAVSYAVHTARDVLKDLRQLTDVETAALAVRKMELINRYNDVTVKAAEAVEKGDKKLADQYASAMQAASEEFDEITRALKKGGTEWGRAGVARRILISEDYSVLGLTRRAVASKGRELTRAETAEFERMAARISELEAMLKTKEEGKRSRVVRDNLEAAAKREREPGRVRQVRQSKAELDAEYEDLKMQVLSLIGGGRRPEPPAELHQADTLYQHDLDPEAVDLIGELFINRVRATRDRAIVIAENLYTELFGLSEDGAPITRREFRDVISEYEKKQKPLSEDSQQIASAKRALRVISQIEDVEAGRQPNRFQRYDKTEEVVDLEAQLRKALKEAGITITKSLSENAKLALRKGALERRIKELETSLASGQPVPRPVPGSGATSPEIDTLKARVAQLREKAKAAGLIPGPRARTEQQRIVAAIRAVEKRIATVENALQTNQPVPRATTSPLHSPELDAARAQLAALNAEAQARGFKPTYTPSDEALLRAARKNAEKQLAKWQLALETGKKPPAPARRVLPEDAEIKRIRMETERVKALAQVKIRDLAPKTIFQRADSILASNVLLNPIARIIDLTANTAKVPAYLAGNPIRVSAGWLLDRTIYKGLQGKPEYTGGRERLLTPSLIRESLRGARDRWKNDAMRALEGSDPDMAAKYGKGTIVTRATGLTDIPFKDFYRQVALKDMAMTKAEKELGKGADRRRVKELADKYFDEPDDDMILVAEDWAIRQTFNIDNVISKGVEWAKMGIAQHIEKALGGKAAGKNAADLMKLSINVITRFSRVIGNVALERANYALPGATMVEAGVRALMSRNAYTPQQARIVADLAAKGLLGMAALYAGRYAVQNGWYAPRLVDPDKGEPYFDDNLLEQIGGIFSGFLHGARMEAVERVNLTDKQREQLWWRSTSDLFLNQPGFTSPKRMMEATEGESSFKKYMGQVAASQTIPGAVREWAKKQDSLKHGLGFWEERPIQAPEFIDQYEKSLPFFRERMPTKPYKRLVVSGVRTPPKPPRGERQPSFLKPLVPRRRSNPFAPLGPSSGPF